MRERGIIFGRQVRYAGYRLKFGARPSIITINGARSGV